jgi:hypothetical protein
MFVDAFGLPKLNQENRKHLNRSIKCNNIKAVIKKSPRPDELTVKIYQTFNGELTPIFLKLPHEIETHSMKPVFDSFQNQTRTQQKTGF